MAADDVMGTLPEARHEVGEPSGPMRAVMKDDHGPPAHWMPSATLDELVARKTREVSIGRLHWIKCYMDLLRFVCRVRLADPDDAKDPRKPYRFERDRFEEEQDDEGGQDGNTDQHKQRRRPVNLLHTCYRWFSNYYLFIYLVDLAHLGAILYYQYSLDISLLQMQQLQRGLSSGAPRADQNQSNLSGDELTPRHRSIGLIIDRLNTTIQQSYLILDALGSPNNNLHFAFECFYLVSIIISLFIYVIPMLVLRYVVQLDVYHLRIVTDYGRELRLCQRVIDEQAAVYTASAQNHEQALIAADLQRAQVAALHQSLKSWQSVRRVTGGRRRASLLCWNRRALERSRSISYALRNRLAEMSASHCLLPLNREPQFVKSSSKFYLVLFLMHLTNSAFFISFSLHSLYLADGLKPVSEYTWANWLHLLNSYALIGTLSFASTFYLSLFLLTVTDLGRLVGELRRRVDEFAERSYRAITPHLDRADSSAGGNEEEEREKGGADENDEANTGVAEEENSKGDFRWRNAREFIRQNRLNINSEILYLLMHYKIFLRQLGSLVSVFRYIATTTLVMMFVLPIISALHVPYFAHDLDQRVKSFLTFINVCVLVPTSCCVFSVCRVICRTNDLYKSLLRVLAHTIDVSDHEQFESFYDKHLILVLRRELSSHPSLDTKFNLAGMRFNYANVMRFFFWLGLTIIAVVLRFRSANASGLVFGASDAFLDDPLGVYTWTELRVV